jgi:hypothetical protein
MTGPFVLYEMVFGKTTLSLIQFCDTEGSVTITPAAGGMKLDADFVLDLAEILKEGLR